jgi:hypothetical protein
MMNAQLLDEVAKRVLSEKQRDEALQLLEELRMVFSFVTLCMCSLI